MIAATFHSPMYSPPNYDFNTIEVFDSLEEVIDALFDRYTSNGKRTIHSTYLDGHTEDVAWPTVEANSYFTCYLMSNNFLSPVLKEEAIMDIHTAVHGGWFDYTVTLDWSRHDDDQLVAVVQKAGI